MGRDHFFVGCHSAILLLLQTKPSAPEIKVEGVAAGIREIPEQAVLPVNQFPGIFG
ncbi:hypothetical protein D3C85_1549140 [compost metagenome]